MVLQRLGKTWFLVTLLHVVLVGEVFAVADVIVQVAGADPATVRVTLEGPGGTVQSADDADADGLVLMAPRGGAGDYRVTLEVDGVRESRAVSVPASGAVTLTYDAGAAGEKLRVAYSPAVEDDEIVVTARRREESIQEIPIAITALPESVLEARSMRNLRDVGDFAPNVDFSVTGGLSGRSSEATVYIRGIGQIDSAFFFDPGVGIYLDGVYMARSQGSVLDLLDLERVEILRGPQGTLFGKNTTGGAISLVTRKPHADFEGAFDLIVGNLDRHDAKLKVNGPLTEKLFGSLTLSSINRGGFSKSRASVLVLGDDNRDSARVSLRWLAGESLVVDFATERMWERETRLDEPLVGLADPPILQFYNNARLAAGLLPYDERWITDDLHESYSTFPGINDGDVSGSTLTLNWTRGDVHLQSISAYRRFDYSGQADADGSPIPFAHPMDRQDQDQLSQELHVSGAALDGRLTWFGGALYFTEAANFQTLVIVLGELFEALEAAPGPIFAPPGVPDVLCDPGPPPPGLPCFGGAGNPANLFWFLGDGNFTREEHEIDSYAAFGEVSYDLGLRLTAALGLRYTREEKEFTFFDRTGNGFTNRVLFNADDWDAWSPRFSLSFQATDDTLVYFSASRGFKSGGFNGRPQMRDELDPFNPEKVLAFELGLKTDLSDRRLRLNAAAFWNDYTDIQFFASLVEAGALFTVVQNAGKAEARGFELEWTWLPGASRPGRGWNISGSVGYIDAGYTELNDVAPDSATLDGSFPKTPAWNVSFSPEYSFPSSSGDVVTLRADYSYKDKVFNDIANSELIAQPAYGLLGARVSYEHRSGRWELALSGANLTDERYIGHGFFPPAFGPAVVVSGRPREWALGAKIRFGQR